MTPSQSNTFAERVMTLRSQAGLTQEAATRALAAQGISISMRSLAGYERGEREPPLVKQQSILRILGHLAATNAAYGNQVAEMALPDHVVPGTAVQLTVYDVGTEENEPRALREHPRGYYAIDLIEVNTLYGRRPNKPFVIEMVGEAMEPEFRSGDRLIIEPYPPGSRTIQAGAIYLVRMEDLIEVRQLERRPGGTLLVSPRNTWYNAYEIALDQSIDFEVIGRVWGKFKRY